MSEGKSDQEHEGEEWHWKKNY